MRWALCLLALSAVPAARSYAQTAPGAAPATVPTVLMTRDPSRASANGMRSMNVITKPVKPTPSVAVTAAPTPAAGTANKSPFSGGATSTGVTKSPFSGAATKSPFSGGATKSPFSGGATTAPANATATATAAKPGAKPLPGFAAAGSGPESKVQVSGLTGTLNKGDIHQTMEGRQELFDACIAESRRRLQWVSGAIHFSFKVDGQGTILSMRTTTSNIGHRQLEQCITNAVATTQFPKPAGRANAEFGWGLSVEPASARELEIASPKIMSSVMRKQVRDVFSSCDIKRRRARFKITAYLTPGGRMLSAGAVPQPQTAEEKVDCVLEQVSKWHLPKVKRSSKVTFELR